jgi:hypothetical protein
VVRHIRSGLARNALVLANGGNVTYQHAICLAGEPKIGGGGYPVHQVLPENLEHLPRPVVDAHPKGEVIIEV